LDKLKKEEDPTWNQKKTAEHIGLEQSTVSERIQVAEAVRRRDPEILAAPSEFQATRIIRRRNQERRAQAQDRLRLPAEEEDQAVIYTANFHEWAPKYPGPPFDFLHLDFPYGIGADRFPQGSASVHGGYDDRPEVFAALCETLRANLNRLCASV